MFLYVCVPLLARTASCTPLLTFWLPHPAATTSAATDAVAGAVAATAADPCPAIGNWSNLVSGYEQI